MNSIAAFGFCCIDDYPSAGISYPTGNGINCIAHLNRRGYRCSAVSVVGTDDKGSEFIDTFQKMGIDVSHMQIKEGRTSVFEMKLTKDNDRVHIKNVPGVMKDYCPTAEDIAFVKKHDYIHTDLFGHVLDILPEIKSEGAKLIMDFSVYANDENMSRLLPYVDYAFFSVGEGKREAGIELLKKAKSFGGHVMTATFGEDGSLSYNGTEFTECAAVKAESVVNTVGAGDSFIAGFMDGVMQGMDTYHCMLNGAKLAAYVVSIFKPY